MTGENSSLKHSFVRQVIDSIFKFNLTPFVSVTFLFLKKQISVSDSVFVVEPSLWSKLSKFKYYGSLKEMLQLTHLEFPPKPQFDSPVPPLAN